MSRLTETPRAAQERHEADQRLFAQGQAALDAVLAAPGQETGSMPLTGDALLDASHMVLRASGIAQNLGGPLPSGESLQQIEQLAQRRRILSRRVQLSEANWWRAEGAAMLAFHAVDGRPLALLPVAGGYRVADPVAGSRVRLDAALAGQLAPTALCFLRRFPERLTGLAGLAGLLRFGLTGSAADLRSLVTAGLAIGLLSLAAPLAMGLLAERVIPGAQSGSLQQLVWLLLCAVLGSAAFDLSRMIAALRIEQRLFAGLSLAVMDRLLHLPARFFRQFAAGDLTQRALGLAGAVGSIAGTAQTVVLHWLFALCSYACMLFVSLPLALLAGLLMLVLLLADAAFCYRRLGRERALAQARGELGGRVTALLSGMRKIRADGAEQRVFAAWAGAYAKQRMLACASRRIANLQAMFAAAWVVVCMLLLFLAVGYFDAAMGSGAFLIFVTAFSQVVIGTLAVRQTLAAALPVLAAQERAAPILAAVPESGPAAGMPITPGGAIDLAHLRFRYQSDGPLILDDLSLHLNPGEFVALVGRSGCGKSTLVRLLLGFEQPQAGAVYFDGQDLAGLDVSAVRRQLGVVLQAESLLPGDLFTNIVGTAPLTLEDAWQAARLAGLADDIKAMPMGMFTVVSESGGALSGGQRQRLQLARALLRKPAILLFDEAGSALDNRSQEQVARRIAGLQTTRLVIAHRLATVKHADRICFMEDGRIVESGSYAALMAQEGRFAAFAQRQLL